MLNQKFEDIIHEKQEEYKDWDLFDECLPISMNCLPTLYGIVSIMYKQGVSIFDIDTKEDVIWYILVAIFNDCVQEDIKVNENNIFISPIKFYEKVDEIFFYELIFNKFIYNMISNRDKKTKRKRHQKLKKEFAYILDFYNKYKIKDIFLTKLNINHNSYKLQTIDRIKNIKNNFL